jgi:Concanavalin A-like lectin/glucanases superfamily/VanZ like family
MSLTQDRSQQKHDSDRVRLLVSIIVLVLGTTAFPVELRRFDFATLSLVCIALDMMANLILYVPVGVVLTRLGFWRGVMIATLLSLFAETCQFFMMHRHPSPIDLALNVAGAMTGLLITWRWRVHVPSIRVNVPTAWLSVLAVLAILGLKARSDWEELFVFVNCRGATLPGSLEAHWTFDETVAGVFYDSSGNGLDGTLIGGTMLADGIHGMAVRVDGEKDYVNFGHPVNLRLMGSMTISAWINSTSFPIDDAAIVSTFSPGYQLDTTVDRGPRTIGFKLVDPSGNLMARYGATELVRDTWYHVAGVYDADARTLNVYLNGHLDDGFLLGQVAPAHLASGQPVCVGRRADARGFAFAGLRGFAFAGLIDDVRIYSRALTQVEIEKAMNGVRIGSHLAGKAAHALASEILEKRLTGHADRGHQPTRAKDALVPGLMVAVGMLSALACAGFWPGHRLPILGVSLAVGLLLFPAAAITLPPYVPWMLPLLSLTGGASVAVSLVRASQRP